VAGVSFSSDAKEELCREPIQKLCCARAEAYGVLLYANTFDHRELRIITGSAGFARRLPRLFRKAFGLDFDLMPQEGKGGKQTFIIHNPDKIAEIFGVYGYDAGTALAHHINFGILEEPCCQAAFIRGAFLAGGSITDPARRYHLELVTDHRSVSRETYSLLLEMGFSPKDAIRGGNYITYFKQSEAIEDFFTTIGAPVAAMEIMSAKVEKDMRNAVNRRVNCDSANADKVVNAAQEQLAAIRRLEHTVGLQNLPDKLQEAAFLRIANPEASLADLAQLADPPVSKSCLNHRLRKLMTYTED
jgi:DNA-binding protein WhiA